MRWLNNTAVTHGFSKYLITACYIPIILEREGNKSTNKTKCSLKKNKNRNKNKQTKKKQPNDELRDKIISEGAGSFAESKTPQEAVSVVR